MECSGPPPQPHIGEAVFGLRQFELGSIFDTTLPGPSLPPAAAPGNLCRRRPTPADAASRKARVLLLGHRILRGDNSRVPAPWFDWPSARLPCQENPPARSSPRVFHPCQAAWRTRPARAALHGNPETSAHHPVYPDRARKLLPCVGRRRGRRAFSRGRRTFATVGASSLGAASLSKASSSSGRPQIAQRSTRYFASKCTCTISSFCSAACGEYPAGQMLMV